MSEVSSNGKNIRHRFTVPTNDTVVNEWIENQSNLAVSLRALIHTYVNQVGISDASCSLLGMNKPVPQKGRPRNDVKNQILTYSQTPVRMNDAVDDNYDDTDDYAADSEDTIEEIKEKTIISPVRQATHKPEKKEAVNPKNVASVKSEQKSNKDEFPLMAKNAPDALADDFMNLDVSTSDDMDFDMGLDDDNE